MEKYLKVYPAKLGYALNNVFFLIFPMLLTIVILTEGASAGIQEWVGVGIFWVLGFIIIFAPLGFKLGVSNTKVTVYFLNLTISEISTLNVRSFSYGNLIRGGLGFGKGLNIRVKKGFSKNHSISEKLYGGDAIKHVQQTLENKK